MNTPIQLTEQDRALPVNINYLLNIRSEGGRNPNWKPTRVHRMYLNVRFRSAVHRALMPGGSGGFRGKNNFGGELMFVLYRFIRR